MTTYLSGNSHVVALADGLKARPALQNKFTPFSFGVGTFELEPMSTVHEGHTEFLRPVLRRRLRKVTGEMRFRKGDSWGLVMGTHNARLYGNDIWQTAALAGAWIPGRRPISEGVLQQLIHADQQHIKQLLLDMKSTGVKVFVVACPAPRRDGSAAKRGVPLETIALIDRSARSSFRAFLAEHDIDFVEEPVGATDSAGFLKPEFARQFLANGKEDPHHANAAYGALMLDEIDAALTAQKAKKAAKAALAPRPMSVQEVSAQQAKRDSISHLINRIKQRHGTRTIPKPTSKTALIGQTQQIVYS